MEVKHERTRNILIYTVYTVRILLQPVVLICLIQDPLVSSQLDVNQRMPRAGNDAADFRCNNLSNATFLYIIFFISKTFPVSSHLPIPHLSAAETLVHTFTTYLNTTVASLMAHPPKFNTPRTLLHDCSPTPGSVITSLRFLKSYNSFLFVCFLPASFTVIICMLYLIYFFSHSQCACISPFQWSHCIQHHRRHHNQDTCCHPTNKSTIIQCKHYTAEGEK